ncbi:MAG: molybdopterin-binding protein [Synechococcales bacterium]|nr:molybdopterin-binding protein [Synechococcales bacterium]
MPRKDQGWITFQASPEERDILETYCQQTQRSKTEVLRELVRNLDTAPPPAPPQSAKHPTETEENGRKKALAPFQVSARNLFQGSITRLHQDGINTEVTVEVAPGFEITSVITTTSAQRLRLKVGKVVCALVKSSNVLIAVSESLEAFAEGSLV